MRTREVVLLGSTGSIGTQALDVVRRNRGAFTIAALTAGGADVASLAAQAAEFAVPRATSATRSSVNRLTDS